MSFKRRRIKPLKVSDTTGFTTALLPDLELGASDPINVGSLTHNTGGGPFGPKITAAH